MKQKKAIFNDFGSLLLAGVIIIILAIVILVFSGIQKEKNSNKHALVSNLEDASYMTRIILQWELESGMKVHEALIKYDEEKNIEKFQKELEDLLKKHSLLPQRNWLLVIKSENTPNIIVRRTNQNQEFSDVRADQYTSVVRNSFLAIPRVTIPHENNKAIEVVIKSITKEDQELYDKMIRAQIYSGYAHGVTGVGPR